ncbi:MAG: META domain-containing protein [Marivita sp.]|uniref:META domain-containing protein n=1 Tax=Marivita sp. TaxID=2003365 RepID=UPI0025BF8D9F|nr:META domain-containing protein [Marivita sp.]MCI5109762.1 META domain-containing protein [Marivita sp.]
MIRSIAALAMISPFLLAACNLEKADRPSAEDAASTQLQVEEWVVASIGGEAVIANSRAKLLFGADGQLSGNASCNRLIASYTVDGEGMTITPSGATMMACEPEAMDQERRLLGLLETVDTYHIDEFGTLVLASASGGQITARR